MKTISTEIASVKENYKLIESLLQRANEEFCCPEERFRNVLIAVSELVMNAIVHANKEKIDKKVKVTVEYDEKEMKIRILDQGNGFKIGQVPDPTKPENILKESGRGIFIVKKLMEEIEQKDTGKGTEIVITIRKKED